MKMYAYYCIKEQPGSEFWVMAARDMSRLLATETGSLRSALGKARTDNLGNGKIRDIM
jgi:hypothetical protein